MALTATLALDVRNFEAGCKKAVVEMQGVERASKTVNRDLKRLMEDFSGQKIAVEATRVAEAVQRVGGASKLTESEQRRVNATVTEAIAKYKALGQEAPKALVDLQAATTKTAQSTGGLVGALRSAPAQIAAVGAAVAAVTAAAAAFWNTIERGGKVSAMRQSFEALSGGSEQARARIDAIRKSTGGLVTDMEAMQAANKAMLLDLGLTDTQMGDLAATATVLGRAMGQDANKSLDDLITALGRSSPMILDNLGLSVKLGEAHEAYARSLGKSTEELTDAEKKQAFMNAALTAAAAKVEQLGGLQLNAADHGHQLWTQIKNLGDATASWVSNLGPVNWAIEGVVNRMKLWEELLRGGLRAGFNEYTRQVQGDIPKAHGVAADAVAASQKRMAASMGPVTMSATEMERVSKKLTDAVKGNAKAFDQWADSLDRLNGKDAAKDGREVVKMLGAMGGPLKVLPSQMKALATSLEQAAEAAMLAGDTDLATQYQQLARTLTPVVQFQQRYNVTIGEYVPMGLDAAEITALLADQIAALSGEVVKIGPGIAKMTGQWIEYQKAATSAPPAAFKETKSDAEDTLQLIIDMTMAAYDFARALQSASQQGSMMERQMSGMKAGARAGSMFGPIGTLVGGFVGLVAGGLLGDPQWVKIMRQVGSQWGLQISEGMAKQLEADMKKLGGRLDLAAIVNLGDIIADQGGLTAQNFSNNWLLAMDAVRQYANGSLTAAQATKTLNETFADFVRAGSDSAGRLNSQMLQLIKYVKESGLEIQAVTDYLQQQAQTAAAGVNAIVNASSKQFDAYQKIADGIAEARAEIDELNKVEARGRGVEWAQKMADAQKRLAEGLAAQKGAAAGAGAELENLGLIALAAYNAAIESGMTHLQALNAAGPALTQLITAYENLGLSTDNAAVKALMMQASLLKNNPELLSGIDGLAQALLAMGNMGVLNEDTFREMQAAGQRMFERLSAEVEKNGGSARDALLPMQAYLREAAEQARRLGIPLDENTQRLIDQSKELGIWQEKSEDPAKTMIGLMEGIRDAVLELGDALRGLPSRVTTEVETNYTSNGQPGGGGGNAGTQSAPGSGPTPTMSANPQYFGGGMPMTFVSKVYIDGREVAVATAPHLPDANRALGV